MTKEEVRELWELCGFKQTKGGDIQWPTGLILYKYPLITLDNLFEWAVPLLIKKHPNYSIHLERFAREDKFIARIGMDIVKADYDPAEALAQACLKALRRE